MPIISLSKFNHWIGWMAVLLLSACNPSDGSFNYTEQYPDGSVKAEGILRSGRANGPWKEYHPSGQLKASGTCKNGSHSGQWTYYGIPGNRSHLHWNIFEDAVIQTSYVSTWTLENNQNGLFFAHEKQDPVYNDFMVILTHNLSEFGFSQLEEFANFYVESMKQQHQITGIQWLSSERKAFIRLKLVKKVKVKEVVYFVFLKPFTNQTVLEVTFSTHPEQAALKENIFEHIIRSTFYLGEAVWPLKEG